jgi:hypothetical protein
VSCSAIWPKAVALPVWTISARPLPLRTLVPIKTQLVRSLNEACISTVPGFFSAG